MTSDAQLSIMMMDKRWGSGDPKKYLHDDHFAVYDDHNYIQYAGVAAQQDAYLRYTCQDTRSGTKPVFVGEWSLAVATDVANDWDPTKAENKDFYLQFWAAQVTSYEKSAQGWVSVIVFAFSPLDNRFPLVSDASF